MTRDTERETRLSGAMLAKVKTDQARREKRAKNAKVRPWKVLEDEWYEAMWSTYGKAHRVAPWGAPEKSLARKLLNDVDVEKAVQMMQRFVSGFPSSGRDGVPSFRLFWAMRESVLAEVEGRVQTRRQRIDAGREFDKEAAEKHIDPLGWE